MQLDQMFSSAQICCSTEFKLNLKHREKSVFRIVAELEIVLNTISMQCYRDHVGSFKLSLFFSVFYCFHEHLKVLFCPNCEANN